MDLKGYLGNIRLKKCKVLNILFCSMVLIYLLSLFFNEITNSLILNQKVFTGQFWRLFSGSLLHSGIGHLIDSSCWLFFLGYQIESRLGSFAFLTLVMTVMIFSGIVHIFFVGTAVEGFSSVSAAMGAFIWRREVKFKEKYYFPLVDKHFLFLGILVWILIAFCMDHHLVPFVINPIIAFLDYFGILHPNRIAHGAHICGFLVGWTLGGLRLLKQLDFSAASCKM
jgi:membrane associated rhomboid family serine protease